MKQVVHIKLAKQIALCALAAATSFAAKPAIADEGGVSFWVPGFFGSLAATPQVPGFSFANVLYYSQVSAGGNVAFAKQVPLGNININFNGNLTQTFMAAPSRFISQCPATRLRLQSSAVRPT